uniref:Uncharacterized protein n=1 Tax=Anopheles culicifacies TaxID=139723 RepID=A0A182LU64_9DIPT
MLPTMQNKTYRSPLKKEEPPKEVTVLVESGSKIFTTDINNETKQAGETPIERIPIETALQDLQTMQIDTNQTASEIVIPAESSTISDQVKTVPEYTETIVESTLHENQPVSIPTTPDETLPDHSNLEEILVMVTPVTKPQTSDPMKDIITSEKMNVLRKSPASSAMSLKGKQHSSSKSSQSSLYSSGPSSSSLCHLTELSQPKPEALRTTLKCLRQLHGKDAKHLASIERHLRGLRSG